MDRPVSRAPIAADAPAQSQLLPPPKTTACYHPGSPFVQTPLVPSHAGHGTANLAPGASISPQICSNSPHLPWIHSPMSGHSWPAVSFRLPSRLLRLASWVLGLGSTPPTPRLHQTVGEPRQPEPRTQNPSLSHWESYPADLCLPASCLSDVRSLFVCWVRTANPQVTRHHIT